jgi:hypothetical protein
VQVGRSCRRRCVSQHRCRRLDRPHVAELERVGFVVGDQPVARDVRSLPRRHNDGNTSRRRHDGNTRQIQPILAVVLRHRPQVLVVVAAGVGEAPLVVGTGGRVALGAGRPAPRGGVVPVPAAKVPAASLVDLRFGSIAFAATAHRRSWTRACLCGRRRHRRRHQGQVPRRQGYGGRKVGQRMGRRFHQQRRDRRTVVVIIIPSCTAAATLSALLLLLLLEIQHLDRVRVVVGRKVVRHVGVGVPVGSSSDHHPRLRRPVPVHVQQDRSHQVRRRRRRRCCNRRQARVGRGVVQQGQVGRHRHRFLPRHPREKYGCQQRQPVPRPEPPRSLGLLLL